MLGVAPPRPEQLPHTVAVEREGAVGRDAEGNSVSEWAAVPGLASVKCLVAPASADEQAVFRQAGLSATGRVFFGPVTPGVLPDVRERDRMPFGTRPDGSARYLRVVAAQNEAELNVLLTVYYSERPEGL